MSPREEAPGPFVGAPGAQATLRDGVFDVPSLATANDPPLTKELALAIVRESTADERAIQSLEEQPLGFVLDAATLGWFAEQGAGDDVVGYLRTRARHEAAPAPRRARDWPGPTEDASPLLEALIDAAREKAPRPEEQPAPPPVRSEPGQ